MSTPRLKISSRYCTRCDATTRISAEQYSRRHILCGLCGETVYMVDKKPDRTDKRPHRIFTPEEDLAIRYFADRDRLYLACIVLNRTKESVRQRWNRLKEKERESRES